MRILKKIGGALIMPASLIALSTILIVLSGVRPSEAYAIFLNGIIGNKNSFCEIFVKGTPLILTGLACTVAFRAGFFNIGAEGQFYMGAVASAAVALRLGVQPAWLSVIASMIAGFLAGGLWSLFAALMKQRFKISEIIVTIMLNYIAVNFVGVAVRSFLQAPGGSMPQSEKLSAALTLPRILSGTRLHIGFLIALLLVLIVWFIMEKTTWGYEMKVVGLNPRAALCCGISVTGGVTRAAMISGGLAGIAGVIEFMAIQKKLLESFSGDAGYTGILIALLAGTRPEMVPVVALLYAAAQVGAASMQRQSGVPAAMVTIMIGAAVIMVLLRKMMVRRIRGGK